MNGHYCLPPHVHPIQASPPWRADFRATEHSHSSVAHCSSPKLPPSPCHRPTAHRPPSTAHRFAPASAPAAAASRSRCRPLPRGSQSTSASADNDGARRGSVILSRSAGGHPRASSCDHRSWHGLQIAAKLVLNNPAIVRSRN